LAGDDGTFHANTVIGSLSGTGSGVIQINIPGTVSRGKHKMRIVSSDPVVYSTVVTIEIPEPFCGDSLYFTSTDTIACKKHSETYTTVNVCGKYQWEIIPAYAGQVVSDMDSNEVEINWNDYNGDAMILATSRGEDTGTGKTYTLYSDTLVVHVRGFDAGLKIDTVTFTITAIPNCQGYSYEWYRYYGYAQITGQTDSTYITSHGDGGVLAFITDSNGCRYATADTIDAFAGVADLVINGTSFRIYPNPGDGSLCIELGVSFSGEVQISVTDLNGRLIEEKKLEKPAVVVIENMDITDQVPGIYLITVSDMKHTETMKFIKH
jgi:hypothetical protein